MSVSQLEEILHPQSIAVVGASGNPTGTGYNFTKPYFEWNYQGKIYPVNPKYPEILGAKSYPSVRDIPGSVDYVVSCVPSGEALKLVDDCAQKGVKAIHFFTARFSETGRKDAIELEQQLLSKARSAGIRIIGPNCLGVYYPRERMSFNVGFPRELGSVGMLSQSGTLISEVVQVASLRGMRFSKAISYGNAIDLNECDYLDYFSQDPETKVIMAYVEGVKDGRRFFDVLRKAASAKPVVVIKGGRGNAGARATASHTASLAGSSKVWEALVAQAGAISAENLDEFIDFAIAFDFLPPITGRRVGVSGGGGGASVLAADECEGAGLEVIPLPQEIREELKSSGSAVWDWVSNPADVTIDIGGPGDFTAGRMLQIMAKNPNFDLLIAIVRDPSDRTPQGMTAEKYLDGYKLDVRKQKPLLAVWVEKGIGNVGTNDADKWRWLLVGETRAKLIEAGVPFYPNIGRAAKAASKLIDYYQRRNHQ